MGNTGSNGSGRRRRRSHPPPPPNHPPQPGVSGNRYVFAASTPYPSQYPIAPPPPHPPPPPPYYHQYPGYYPPPPPQVPPGTYGQPYGNWVGGHYPYGGGVPNPTPVAVTPPYVEHQKAVTIRNDINIKKDTLRIEPDEDDPGKFLATFTFDATSPGSITVIFFAKETEDCNLVATKESICKPITISFEQGLGQKFRQPSGTGVDSSLFEDTDWRKDGEIDIYPLVVKAEACPSTSSNENPGRNSQVTQAVIEKERDEFKARVVKQILWVNGMRYELQEIYGIRNAVEGEVDGNDSAKECVVCLSEPRDTTVLPCRHMCMCSGCAKVLRFQSNRCPICRQPVERLLEIKVNDGGGEGSEQSTSRETTPTS